MAVINTFKSILETGEATTEQALALFDSLEPVDLPFMFDRWRGSGLHTGHPLDGFLEATNWYGKEFVDADCVHPLLFSDGNGNIFKIKPNLALMRLSVRSPLLKSQALLPMLRLTTPLFQTQQSQARLRMVEYRDRVSATMIYDCLPINDIFRRVDENTLLGLMDFKGVPQPFFFVLRRDRQPLA
jgi:hypothetical protein